jgi:L-iditol 2-dehydrogenase
MMLEMGNFAGTGEISLNVHRHICSKNIRLIGLTNHPSTGYGPALRLLEHYSAIVPVHAAAPGTNVARRS